MNKILPTIHSPADLAKLSDAELAQLADEIREALCSLVSTRSAHFASNLGVVELAIALHTSFDFRVDRLIWDTGHQIYPHKLLTGRYDEFPTIRSKGGLMGYPNPAESEYDLFLTGHAGCSVSTALGLRCGDELVEPNRPRNVVAVIGDGSFMSGIVVEAMNNAGGLKKNLVVILNDNKMSICPRVGGLAESLDRLRMTPFYAGLKAEVQRLLGRLPVFGDPVERLISQVKAAMKAGLLGGMFFEELGFRYIGPVDGHNIKQLQKYLGMTRQFQGPVLLHVVTEKGHGYEPAAADPTSFHAPPPLAADNGQAISARSVRAVSYTEVVRDALLERMRRDPRVVVITAAMCQGNMLEPIRDEFPTRFFDVGICESHAVAFAAGLAKAGLRPVVDIYSTFLQRAYDQIFQEASLADLPILFLLDRAGLVGPDGPTHHGVFDLTYLRPFPNLIVLAPGDKADAAAMVEWAFDCPHPTAIRYPKAAAEMLRPDAAPIELGSAEVLRRGPDGALIACGTLAAAALKAAKRLAADGRRLTVVNARFVKPLDVQTLLSVIEESPWTLTIEEGQLHGGFGSAVLEAANDAGLDTRRILRLGIPDRYIEHGERDELLAELGLDTAGIVAACRKAIARRTQREADRLRVV